MVREADLAPIHSGDKSPGSEASIFTAVGGTFGQNGCRAVAVLMGQFRLRNRWLPMVQVDAVHFTGEAHLFIQKVAYAWVCAYVFFEGAWFGLGMRREESPFAGAYLQSWVPDGGWGK